MSSRASDSDRSCGGWRPSSDSTERSSIAPGRSTSRLPVRPKRWRRSRRDSDRTRRRGLASRGSWFGPPTATSCAAAGSRSRKARPLPRPSGCFRRTARPATTAFARCSIRPIDATATRSPTAPTAGREPRSSTNCRTTGPGPRCGRSRSAPRARPSTGTPRTAASMPNRWRARTAGRNCRIGGPATQHRRRTGKRL